MSDLRKAIPSCWGDLDDGAWYAAQRDASWYVRPKTGFRARMHMSTGDGTALCNKDLLLAFCSREFAPDVPSSLRCKRKACAAGYKTAEEERVTHE